MRSRVGWCCQTALPQHIHCTFFETPSISLREISFVIINRTRAGACLLLTKKPPQPVRVQRLELRSLKFRRSIHVCLRTPAALHDHKSCGSKRPHLPHPRLHARIPASPQAYRCGAAAPRAFTAHTCAPRAPRTYTYAPCCICGPSIMSVFCVIAFSLGHTLGISTKLFMCLRLLSRRILSYFNLHFTTRSRPGKSLITTAGEYFPESFNILRRSSPWSWPISTSRKPSGFRKSAAFSTMVL